MSARLALLAALALLACGTLASPERSLLKSASLESETSAKSSTKKGRASARSRLKVSDGKGSAAAQADAQAIEKANDEIKSIVLEVLEEFPKQGRRESKEDYCEEVAAFLEADVIAIGEAAAEVTVDTFGVVEIDGVGEGCAETEAQASAQAVATVEVVVDAWAEAAGESDTATAQASLKGATDVLAKAAAAATANACIESDGTAPAFAEAYQTVVAKAYGKAVASILVFLEASVDCAGESDVFADAEVGAVVEDEDTVVDAQGGSTVEGKGSADTTAEAEASTTQVVPCKTKGSLRICCRGSNKKRDSCFCNLSGKSSRNPKCEAERVDDKDDLIWEFKEDGETAACKCQ